MVLLGLMVALLWPRRAELEHAWRTFGRKGALAYQEGETWVVVGDRFERMRSWTEADAFLREAAAFRALEPGVELGELRLRREPNPAALSLVLVRVDPQLWRFRVLADSPFSAHGIRWFADQARSPLAVNASYFSEEGPVGLLIQDGQVRVPQGHTWAAHFLVSAGEPLPHIVNQRDTELDGVLQGFQGFPAIMSEGQTWSYMRYGNRGFPVHELARRTAACVDREDWLLLLVTDSLTNGLTLDELATVLGGLGCVDAMGFDGGSSTSLWLSLGGQERLVKSRDGVPVALGIERR